ncbi:MAG: sodium:proton antiporter [Planctomycetes bacterium]|nr:sodium:proton antiporter [Planctomycetota bacterium]
MIAALPGSELPPSAHGLGQALGLASVLPFVLLLACIAVLPLVANHWWEKNRNKGMLAGLFALPVVLVLSAGHGQAGQLELTHAGMEYASFIVLLGALFVITGGVYVGGSLAGTPLANSGMLAFGALIASFVGTTGASVLLIRPFLRANATRQRKVHLVVFFIFVVSNCGGLLTPLGDPPLFLGYLKGVPFGWTLQLWKEWLLVNGALLVLFHLWDQRVLNAEELARPGAQLEEVMRHEPLRIEGGLNFLFLLGVVATIYCAGAGLGTGGEPWPFGAQEGAMLALAAGAWFTTRASNRERNRFSWSPVIEVAVLFAGIFATMTPALLILNAWGQGQREVLGLAFGMREPWQFFWGTGILSSFLDNAPTYLTLASTACGLEGVPLEGRYLGNLLANSENGALGVQRLLAISCGAVFMGANTYIGNGPNFMVKAIAEEAGVKMPSFFGYMAYSGLILLPLFVLVTLLFFR